MVCLRKPVTPSATSPCVESLVHCGMDPHRHRPSSRSMGVRITVCVERVHEPCVGKVRSHDGTGGSSGQRDPRKWGVSGREI